MPNVVNTTIKIHTADRIRAWMAANKVTQVQLAELIGTRRGTLCNALQGCSGLNPEIYAKLMELINNK